MSISNPSPNPPPPPRTLNVQKFAESRSRELESLHSIVSDRLDHDFKIHRSKRRRTTGYRSSKHRIRKNSDAGSDPKATRRVRRRLELQSNPESGFVRSGDGTKRLRTHLWHAKRFTMVKRWGFYLPLGLQGSGRGSRAVLKWLKSGALVHDASYCHPIQLEGPEDSIVEISRMVLLPHPSSISQDIFQSVEYGVCYTIATMYHVGPTLSQFIAPVVYMWRPFLNGNNYADADQDHVSSTYRQLWIWIHAAAFQEGFDALRAACQKQMHDSPYPVSCVSLEGRIAKLDIMGSKAVQILQRTLHPVPDVSCAVDGMRNRSDTYLSACSYLTSCGNSQLQKPFLLQHAEHLPSNSVLSLTVSDPRGFPPKETGANLETGMQGSDLPEQDVQSSNHLDSGTSAQSEDNILALWSQPEKNSVVLSDSRYLWGPGENLKPPVPENMLCADRHQKRLKQFFLDPTNDEKSALETRDCFSQSCPILLLKHANKRNSNTGWSIVLPLSWVKAFWISLISNGAHAIGLRERRWIACDNGLPSFPHDFPDSKAYSLLMSYEAASYDDWARLRPPAVRPSSIPIPPPWDCIESTLKKGLVTNGSRNPTSLLPEQSGALVNGFVPRYFDALNEYLEKPLGNGMCLARVLVRACKEGVFEDGAIVCAPILTDLPCWDCSSDKERKLQIPQSLVKSYFTRQDSGKWELQLPENCSNCSNLESYRWPVGFVTTGFIRGSKRPTAIGFCEAKLLAQLREQQQQQRVQDESRREICVLVRNLRSAAYRCAFATIVLEEEKEDSEFI